MGTPFTLWGLCPEDAVIHLSLFIYCSGSVCVCLFVFGRNASQHGGTNNPDQQHRSHPVSCPLLPLLEVLSITHCYSNTVKLNFKVFHLPNPAAFSGSDSRSRCGRGETEPGRSQRDWRISTSQCSISKSCYQEKKTKKKITHQLCIYREVNTLLN